MKIETLKKYIGNTYGVLTILGLDHEEYDKTKQIKRSYFKCKCNRCNSITIVRSDRFGKGKYIPKSCSNCINDLQREIAYKKWNTLERKPIRNRINSIKSAAKGRNYKIELTDKQIEDFLNKPCFYCNCEHANGIDRINSKEHYIINNCVPCCSICNRMKNKYDLNTFLNKIRNIYNNFYNKSSTTISKESTSEAIADGNGESLNTKVKENDIV